MIINYDSFRNGGEIDYQASLEMMVAGLGIVEGRASLRKNGRHYQAYLHARKIGSMFVSVPPVKVEVVLFETEDLEKAVAWCNDQFYGNDPELVDTYEAPYTPFPA